MKITLKQSLSSLCIIVVMLISSSVYSQTPGDHPMKREGIREKMKARMLEIFEQLHLSPEQEEQLKAHRNKHREKAGGFLQSIRAKRDEMRSELQEEELNMERVYALHAELKDLYSKKADHRLEGILEVRKILTPEQFKKFCELRKELRSERRGKGKFY